MGMSTGGSGAPNINVTPLIDVLLVLLIIFMVITPLTPKGLSALVPQPPKSEKTQDDPERTIVVQVLKAGGDASYKINMDDTRLEDLQQRLLDIFKTRAEKVAFVKGDPDVTFDKVAVVIDKIHAAGVDKVGLMTPKIEAGK